MQLFKHFGFISIDCKVLEVCGVSQRDGIWPAGRGGGGEAGESGEAGRGDEHDQLRAAEPDLLRVQAADELGLGPDAAHPAPARPLPGQ